MCQNPLWPNLCLVSLSTPVQVRGPVLLPLPLPRWWDGGRGSAEVPSEMPGKTATRWCAKCMDPVAFLFSLFPFLMAQRSKGSYGTDII